MVYLYAWVVVTTLYQPGGDRAIYDWVNKGTYDSFSQCKKVAQQELKLPKFKCVSQSSPNERK